MSITVSRMALVRVLRLTLFEWFIWRSQLKTRLAMPVRKEGSGFYLLVTADFKQSAE